MISYNMVSMLIMTITLQKLKKRMMMILLIKINSMPQFILDSTKNLICNAEKYIP